MAAGRRIWFNVVSLEVQHLFEAPGAVRLILSNPHVNATSIADLGSPADAIKGISEDDRVAVLSAIGNGFSAGGDLEEMDQLDGYEGIFGQCLESARACTAISRCDVPVIVVVHDYCLGVDIELVGSADIAVANEAALFQWTEIDNGTVGGAAQDFRMLSLQFLRHLMFTAEPITAQDLWNRGALTEDKPLTKLEERAQEIAQIIANKSPNLVRHLEASMDAIEAFDVGKAMRFEQGYIFQLNMEGSGSAARTAFLEGTREGLQRKSTSPDT
jgi:enoyl-CoA hydratase